MSQQLGYSRGVARLIAVLDHVATVAQGRAPKQIAADLKLPRSSAYTLAKAMDEGGLLQRRASGDYVLGPLVRRLGFAYAGLRAAPERIDAALESLERRSGGRACLSMLDRDRVLIFHVLPGASEPWAPKAGLRYPVNWLSAGRVLLQGLPERELRDFLAQGLRPSATGNAPLDDKLLLAEIRAARKSGYALAAEQLHSGVNSIAVPAAWRGKAVACALSLLLPAEHGVDAQLIDAVRQAAAQIDHPG